VEDQRTVGLEHNLQLGLEPVACSFVSIPASPLQRAVENTASQALASRMGTCAPPVCSPKRWVGFEGSICMVVLNVYSAARRGTKSSLAV